MDEQLTPTGIERERPTGPGEVRTFVATPWQLMWWQFRKHQAARVALVILAIMYAMALLAEPLSTYGSTERFPGYENVPPSRIRFIDGEGRLRRPFFYDVKRTLDPATVRVVFVEDTSEAYTVRFLTEGTPYRILGTIPARLRLLGSDGPPIFVFGSDHLGRDIYSRTLIGARISLFIGFGGVLLTFLFGISLGGISGFVGGVVDEVIMRVVDFMVSIPQIPLWMALAAAVPRDWPVIRTYFAITLILSIVGWGGLARTVRGKLLSLREEDYVMAARVYGASPRRLIFRYLLPNFMSYLLVNVTISIPSMILGETSLSFLGLGIQPPAVSWGALLRDVQQLTVVAQRPWQMIPGAFVVLAVLMFNFIGDGLRDAADPYARL